MSGRGGWVPEAPIPPGYFSGKSLDPGTTTADTEAMTTTHTYQYRRNVTSRTGWEKYSDMFDQWLPATACDVVFVEAGVVPGSDEWFRLQSETTRLLHMSPGAGRPSDAARLVLRYRGTV